MCPVGQKCPYGGDGSTGPLDNISCPGASSCAHSTPYTVSEPTRCVTKYGYFTTGCGGPPGSGIGTVVFWLPDHTCYQYLPTAEYSCFASTNFSAYSSNNNLTRKYCWYAAETQTQHYFDVPASPNGSEAVATYSDPRRVIGVGFAAILASNTTNGVAWGGTTGAFDLGPLGASPTSTSNVAIFANGAMSPILSVPVFSGYASATNTTGNCAGPFPNG